MASVYSETTWAFQEAIKLPWHGCLVCPVSPFVIHNIKIGLDAFCTGSHFNRKQPFLSVVYPVVSEIFEILLLKRRGFNALNFLKVRTQNSPEVFLIILKCSYADEANTVIWCVFV